MANQDYIQSMLRDRFGGALDSAAKFGNTSGLNQALNNPIAKKLRMASLATKLTGVMGGGASLGLGSETIDDMITYGSGGMVAFGAAPSAKQTNQKLNEAMLRRQMQQSGHGTGMGDVRASAANTAANIKSAAMKGSALSMMSGLHPTALTMMGMGPGGFASHLAGGVGGLGGAATGAAASMAGMMGAGSGITTAMAGMNPVVAGMMTMMAMQKGGKKLFEVFNKDSSTKNQMDRKWTITKPLGAGELKEQYGMATIFGQRILQLQSLGSISPAEALLANIMTAVETNTAVLPLMAAEQLNEVSRKEKEGGNSAQNLLDELFGSDGSDQIVSSDTSKRGLFQKIFGGLEQGSANLNSILDLGGQFSNLLEGKSSVALYNEANDRSKLEDPLGAEKKYAEKFGLSLSHSQALNQSAAQLISGADSYDGKMLAMLGGIFTTTQLSGAELLKIRTDGFGISQGSSHGYLAKMRADDEEKQAMDYSFYNDWLRGMDEMVGYLPGVASISNAFKAASSAESWLGDMIKGEAIRDEETGEITGRKEKRTMGKVFSDWISDDAKNKTLNSESELRAAVGAVEMGPAELMQNYLGKAYPDRFELLLKYNRHQMESLAALVGPIARTEGDTLTMNKYDGVFGNQDYHTDKDATIADKIQEEMERLNPVMGRFSNWFIGNNQDEIINNQIDEGMSKNPFLKEIIENGVDSESDSTTAGRYQAQTSVQDGQNAQKTEDRRKHQMSNSDKQLSLLEDIRDCVCCNGPSCGGKGGGKGKGKNRYNSPGTSMFGDMDYTGVPGMDINRSNKPNKPTKHTAPKAPILKKMKHFFTKGGWKKLFTLENLKKGGAGLWTAAAALISRLPFLGTVLANPYVLGGIAAAVSAYAIYEYGGDLVDIITGKTNDEKNIDKELEESSKRIGGRLEHLEQLASSSRTDLSTVVKRLSNKALYSDAMLKDIAEKNTTDGILQEAIAIVLKDRKLHPDYADVATVLTATGYEDGGEKVFDNLSLKGKKRFYKEANSNWFLDNGNAEILNSMKQTIDSEQTAIETSKLKPHKMGSAMHQALDGATDIESLDIIDMFVLDNMKINTDDLDPTVLYNLKAMGWEYFQKHNKKMHLNSAFRSFAEQEKLFKNMGPKRAAAPGNSMHNYGMAIDINSTDITTAKQDGLMKKYRFQTPVKGEGWHIEPKGIDRKGIRTKGVAAYKEAKLHPEHIITQKEKAQDEAIAQRKLKESKRKKETTAKLKNVNHMTNTFAKDSEISIGEMFALKGTLETIAESADNKEQLEQIKMQTKQLDLLIKAVMQGTAVNVSSRKGISINRITEEEGESTLAKLLKINPVHQNL